MKDISKKVAYLKGLLEGMYESEEENEENEDSRDSKVNELLEGILDALEQFDDTIDTLNDKVTDLNDFVESIDDTLTQMEAEDFDLNHYSDPDLPYDDEDLDSDDFDPEDYDDDDPFEEKLHVARPNADTGILTCGRLCSKCGRLFLIPSKMPPKAEYKCPYCGSKMRPSLIDIDELPVIAPEE